LEREQRRAEQAPRPLPADPPIGKHGYGPRLVSLAVNLGKAVGLRGANRAMKIFFDWLGVAQKVPFYSETYYGVSPDRDPLGPRSGNRRVLRGGNWKSAGKDCRSARRGSNEPTAATQFGGFRVVMIPS
jgi:hypothetical protein